mmetsp:Transcript_19969/g.50037  ORF Transcript_19969/g.50037 Transcript_19969/m.50037 type:complete len:86 (+) Transcript_19969:147-404(+)
MNDASAGLAICLASTVLFAYYTVWVLVTPFVEPGHVVLRWFPDRVYAVLVPAYLGACLVSAVSMFLGYVMLTHDSKKGKSKPKSA